MSKQDLTDWSIQQANEVITSIKTQMPAMTDAVIEVARYSALNNLVLALLITVAIPVVVWKLIPSIKALHQWIMGDFEGMLYGLIAPVYGGIFLFFLFQGVLELINIWNWIGLFQPKLYLAHAIIEKVLSR